MDNIYNKIILTPYKVTYNILSYYRMLKVTILYVLYPIVYFIYN